MLIATTALWLVGYVGNQMFPIMLLDAREIGYCGIEPSIATQERR